jgi:hypothetical protein
MSIFKPYFTENTMSLTDIVPTVILYRISRCLLYYVGNAVAQLVEAQAGRSRVRFPVIPLVFFMDIILPAAR